MNPSEHRARARQTEVTAALDMVDFALELQRLAPELGSTTFPFADGHAVLCGPGMYVNDALAVGFDAVPTPDQMDRFEAACVAVGVSPQVEVHEHSRPDVFPMLTARGYVPEPDDRTAGLATVPAARPAPGSELDVQVVDSPALLLRWQEATALGWGHTTLERRRASDRFSAVAQATQQPGLLLATDPSDGRTLGCASLSIRDDVAVLGGMSTLPAERGRGVQHALIRHRLGLAAAAGCALAVTHADASGGSIRNLQRLGFQVTHTKTSWRLAAA